MIKILFLGEIIGLPTLKKIKKNLKPILSELKIDFTIANCDGASDGYGVLKSTAIQLLKAGINVLTSGDFIYNKKDIKEFLNHSYNVLRPYNLPLHSPGKGYTVFQLNDEVKIGVLNILGRSNFHKVFAENPFYYVDKAIQSINKKTDIIIVDFHGGTTSEIQAMHWYLAKKVSAVIGTHLRVLTSDNRIIEDRTGIITGSGYCGAKYSVFGFEPNIEIVKFKTGEFRYSRVESSKITLQGVVLEVDETSGKTLSIDRFERELED